MTRNKKYEAVLFDLDGTLIDSAPDVHACVNEMQAIRARPSVSIAEVKKFIGSGAEPLVRQVLERNGESTTSKEIDENVQLFLKIYRANPVRYGSLFPEVVETLELLLRQGLAMGICTNKPEATTLPVLEKFNLQKYLSVISCGDKIQFQKPDPRHIDHAMGLLGSSAQNTLFVGDSMNDVIAAKKAGVDILAVTFGYEKPDLLEKDATSLINRISDVVDFIAQK